MDYDRRLAVFRAAGLAPEEGVPIILPNRMPGDSTRYANGMPDGWGDGDERPSDEYIACQIAQDNLRHGNPGTDGRIDSDLFDRLRDGEGLQEWLDAGGDPNIRVTHQPPTFDGPYPSVPDFHTGGTPLLFEAARTGRVETVRLLLSHGADPNVRDPLMLETPLHVVAHSCGKEDVSQYYAGKSEPVIAVRMQDSIAIARLLLDAGADINAFSQCIRRPLAEAMGADSKELVRFLLSRGSTLDPGDLHIAQENLRHALAPPVHDLQGYIPATENGRWINTCRLVIDVCEAGGYRAYVSWTAPRQDLLAFRVFVERGRARARDALLGRTFGLPKELFCVIVSFWRTSRDVPDDFDDFPSFRAPLVRR